MKDLFQHDGDVTTEDSFDQADWKQTTVDSILLQTSSPKLWERALQDNVSYKELLKLGIAKE